MSVNRMINVVLEDLDEPIAPNTTGPQGHEGQPANRSPARDADQSNSYLVSGAAWSGPTRPGRMSA